MVVIRHKGISMVDSDIHMTQVVERPDNFFIQWISHYLEYIIYSTLNDGHDFNNTLFLTWRCNMFTWANTEIWAQIETSW